MKERRFRFDEEDIKLLVDFVEAEIKKALKNKRLDCENTKLQRIYILGERLVKRKSTYYATYWHDNERMRRDLKEMLKSIKEFRATFGTNSKISG